MTLAIGLKVARALKENGFRVKMTRKNDMTLSVEQRVHNINAAQDADLLVSVHANSGSVDACGLETYCIDKTGFFLPATCLSAHGIAYVREHDTQRYEQGQALARAVHAQVLKITQAPDRSVRSAITRLLLGIDVPAILIETGYISHSKESTLLGQAEYQDKIACGICRGVVEYFNLH